MARPFNKTQLTERYCKTGLSIKARPTLIYSSADCSGSKSVADSNVILSGHGVDLFKKKKT